jgi:hypothetical protein
LIDRNFSINGRRPAPRATWFEIVQRKLAEGLENAYVWCMTVETIKEAIVHLSEPERKQLTEWFDELEEEAWDRQMEKDFSPGGRGTHLLEKVDREIETGNHTSLDEGLRQHRVQREK